LLKGKTNNNFGLSFFFTIAIMLAIGVVILVFGKNDSFQLINSHNHPVADLFFKYYTYAGDGLMWALLIIFFIFSRHRFLIAIVSGLIISTALSQFLKRIIFFEDFRPITYLSENFPVHTVGGVLMNKLHSFPSGHTATAFTIALLLAFLINKKAWSIILPLLALLVGYSRVYLAQHFLTDVLLGILIGIISAIFSLMIYRTFVKSLQKKNL
jgi:membrane-associated phospholipid phosphatase